MNQGGDGLPDVVKPDRSSEAVAPESRSFMDVELTRDGLNLFEREGDGMTAALIEVLKRYGLRLSVRVSSPCG